MTCFKLRSRGTSGGLATGVYPGNSGFATYFEDQTTGLDYADQRFSTSTYGRFMTADPYWASAGPEDPGSWNRYSYVKNNPVNLIDRRGLIFGIPGDDCVEGARCDVGGGPGAGWDDWGPGPGIDFGGEIQTGGGGSGGGGGGAPPSPTKKDPECFAQLKDRPVNDPDAAKVYAVHTFWWIQDESGTQYIVSAGPDKPTGVRYLNTYVTPGRDNGNGDASSAHLSWSSGLGAWLCDSVENLLSAAEYWQKTYNGKIEYNAFAIFGFAGPNSNSAAHYFSVAGNFTTVTQPATAYGWSSSIPFP